MMLQFFLVWLCSFIMAEKKGPGIDCFSTCFALVQLHGKHTLHKSYFFFHRTSAIWNYVLSMYLKLLKKCYEFQMQRAFLYCLISCRGAGDWHYRIFPDLFTDSKWRPKDGVGVVPVNTAKHRLKQTEDTTHWIKLPQIVKLSWVRICLYLVNYY